jgi:signal transduction histidine kinase
VTTDPAAEHPSFRHYSTENGLASDAVRSIAEDDQARMYFATGRGLDRLSVATDRIRHFSVADGLAGDQINYCVKDRLGRIWIGASGGVSRLDPRAERAADQAPPIYISRLTVAGEDRPLPADVGQQQLILPPSRNDFLIEFVGLSFRGALKYQYKLDGVDGDWSAPGDARSVNYVRLSTGFYRFMVRAVNQEGLASLEPAVLEFRIMAPLWQRWWFLTIAAMAAALMVCAGVRYRVARLIELERVRTRIATDLHDDIGSNLSLVAMLTEVVRREVGREDPRVIERLKLVARISRELVDSMSDIVWAVNPNKDWIQELTQRMRRFASDVLTARGITIHFRAEGAEQDVKMGAEVRRQIYLIFKETLNNVARHSECTVADVELKIDGRELLLQVRDNGKGFDQSTGAEGNGLASMRRRAEEQGGILRVASESGRGTTVTLRVPLGRRKLNSGVHLLSQRHSWFESRGPQARDLPARLAGRSSGSTLSGPKTTR